MCFTSKKWLGWLAMAVLAGLLIAACSSTQAPSQKAGVPTATASAARPQTAPATAAPQGPAAIVNGQAIPMAAFLQEVQQRQAILVQKGVNLNTPQGAAQLEQMKQQVLDNLIDDVLVTQDAAKQGITVSDAEVDTEIQNGISVAGGQAKFDEQLKLNGQTLDDARAAVRTELVYQKVLAKVVGNIQTAEQVHFRDIRVDTQAKAQDILAQIQAGADFGQMAQQYSLDKTMAPSGGDQGWVPRGKVSEKEVEDAIFALQPGQISNVVQAADGFHIVQVLERDPARKLEGDSLVEAQQQAMENYLNSLRMKAQVQRLALQ